MAELKTDALVKSVETLVAEKMAVTAKEKELVDGLNAVLSKMGYRVVTTAAVPKRRGRPPGSEGRRPDRPQRFRQRPASAWASSEGEEHPQAPGPAAEGED